MTVNPRAGLPMKGDPDSENEIWSEEQHHDEQVNRVTPVVQFAPEIAMGIVSALGTIVRRGHEMELENPTPAGSIQRAQVFEEGYVYLLEPPFQDYFADRYLMDFYDVRDRDICSRMHIHTGLRFVRMMTGPETAIRVSSLSPFIVTPSVGWHAQHLRAFVDDNPVAEGRTAQTRFNIVVPENSWVDMQIPRGVSHQFNADGPNAIIDSVHPEESIETLREGMSGYKMMAQTIFLAESKSDGETCYLDDYR
jgi:hypothetical protein